MGKYIANTATSYRFIACLGIFGLIAAMAIGQTTGNTVIGPFAHPTLRGVNIFSTQVVGVNSAGQIVPVLPTTFNSATSTLAIPFPVMPAQPVINGFTNPFTGVTSPAVLIQGSTSTTTSGGSSVGGSTSGGGVGTGGGAGNGGIAGTGGGGGTSGGAGGGFTVLPSISAVPNGGNSLSGGANSGGVVGGVGGSITGASGTGGASGNTGVSGATGTLGGAGGGAGGAISGGLGGGTGGSKGSFCGGYGI